MSENVKDAVGQGGVGCIGSLSDKIRRTLDSKSRLTISANLRQLMGQPEYVYLVPGLKDETRCVVVLPPDVYDGYFEQFKGLPGNHPKRRSVEAICAACSQATIDVQGRIRLTEKFLEYAGLEGDVVMEGALDRIKIWADDGKDSVDKVNVEEFTEACDEIGF